ncbi:hypothetical protein WJX73_007207 [Symbiochloris irregularis]|uniref:Protein kinase domain-containing protein n=1 Tax=Symbiochloris irregularis TaxID=706552 RepID=A0AAW1NRE2_9CHLO
MVNQSPEMVRKTGHGTAADMWGRGVIPFVLLSEKMPFSGRSEAAEVVEGRITAGRRKSLPQHVSPEARQLVGKVHIRQRSTVMPTEFGLLICLVICLCAAAQSVQQSGKGTASPDSDLGP